jgi:hypothetical protein
MRFLLGELPRWIEWRANRLRAAGFRPELADRLALHERIDVHELLELVDRGCPPDLAARILAPLDDRGEQR